MAQVDLNSLANTAQQVSTKWQTEAEAFLNTLKSLVGTTFNPSLANPNIPIVYTTRDDDMRTAIDGKPARPGGLAFVAQTDPGASPTVSIRDAALVTVPTFDEAAPILDLPTRPAQVTPDKPMEPTIKSVAIPTSPTLSLPTAPTLSGVSFPDAPTIELPEFSQAFPIDPTFLISTTQFDFKEDPVATPLMDEAGTLLLSDMQNGGYGIDPDDEEQLWERLRDRALRQGQESQEQVLEEFASRGHSMPPGAAHAAMRKAHAEAQQNLSEASREVSIQRAQLLREARQFAITQGTEVDNIRLQQAGFKMERALNASRYAVELSIAVHDATVGAYNAKVQAYVSFTQGYRATVEAELAKVQIFSEEVRAAVEQLRAQQIEVDLYSALIAASQAQVGLYETQVRAAVAELDVERIKLEAYRSQVEVFATEVRANALEFDAYEAGVRGELSKTEVFRSQVDSFRTQVQAASIESDIQNRQVQVDIAKTGAETTNFAAQVDAFRSRIAQETARVDALLREFGADTQLYTAGMNAWEGLARVSVAEIEALARQFISQVQLEQTNSKLQLEAVIEQARTRFDAANAGQAIADSWSSMAKESLGVLATQIEEVA